VVASTNVKTAEDLAIDTDSLAVDFPDVKKHLLLSDGSSLPRVHSLSFVPQVPLLASVGVDLYVTHGGNNSFHEALFTATPIAVAPFFGDQPAIAIAASELGNGVALITPEWTGVTEGEGGGEEVIGMTVSEFIEKKMEEICSPNSSFKEKAKEIRNEMTACPPAAVTLLDLIVPQNGEGAKK